MGVAPGVVVACPIYIGAPAEPPKRHLPIADDVGQRCVKKLFFQKSRVRGPGVGFVYSVHPSMVTCKTILDRMASTNGPRGNGCPISLLSVHGSLFW